MSKMRLLLLILFFSFPAPCRALAGALVLDGNRIMDQPMAENLCALTFDDGPSRYTPELLDMLKAHGIPATFFVLGHNARCYPEIVRRAVAEGHEIGSHSYSHPNLRRLTPPQQAEQIGATDEILRSLGAAPLYLRPPYGAFDETTLRLAGEMGISIVLWSLDSYDWKHLPADYSKLRSTRGTVYPDGDLHGIFLFHDIHKNTVDDFPRIIAQLRAGGCERFVTVSDYLAGIQDPEPGLLMTRRRQQAPMLAEGGQRREQPAAAVAAPAGTAEAGETAAPQAGPRELRAPKPEQTAFGDIPLARCSKPWPGHEKVAHVDDEQLQGAPGEDAAPERDATS